MKLIHIIEEGKYPNITSVAAYDKFNKAENVVRTKISNYNKKIIHNWDQDNSRIWMFEDNKILAIKTLLVK